MQRQGLPGLGRADDMSMSAGARDRPSWHRVRPDARLVAEDTSELVSRTSSSNRARAAEPVPAELQFAQKRRFWADDVLATRRPARSAL